MKERLKEAKALFESWNPSQEERLTKYIQMFPEQYEKFRTSPRAKIKGLNEHDLYNLGRTFEQQLLTRQLHEDQSFAQLGAQPTMAYDFITALYGKSVIPYVASEQVIDEIQGLVYFENIYAMVNRGNVERGDILAKAAGAPSKYPAGFAGEMVYGEQIVDADTQVGGENQTFSTTLLYKPIRPNYTSIICDGVKAVDDGNGNLIGAGAVGTINYATGEVEITFVKELTANEPVIANYATNFELGALPSIQTALDTKFIRANVYGLQTDTSILSSYMTAKRFSYDMQQRAVQILQETILGEITNELIMKIESAVVENSIDAEETMFDCTLPPGVSLQAHFNGVDYTFGIVSQKLAQRSGKGTLSVALAGIGACSFLEQNARFERIGEKTAFATVFGVYDKQTIVIRCPQLSDINTIYFAYKGESPFDASCVYAPYMPLVGVEDLPVSIALLNRRSAVASMAAVDVVVPGYLQKFSLINVPKFTNKVTTDDDDTTEDTTGDNTDDTTEDSTDDTTD